MLDDTLAKPQRRSITQKERRLLTNAWGAQCAYCESRNGPFDIDHIVPHSRGGSCDIENLCLSCYRCNQRKKASPLPQFYEGLLLSIATRKAARIRKVLAGTMESKTYGKPRCAREAVFGREYVRKYMKTRARGSTAPVTADQLLNYERLVSEAATLRQSLKSSKEATRHNRHQGTFNPQERWERHVKEIYQINADAADRTHKIEKAFKATCDACKAAYVASIHAVGDALCAIHVVPYAAALNAHATADADLNLVVDRIIGEVYAARDLTLESIEAAVSAEVAYYTKLKGYKAYA
jgi:5-methylcytosine-specific restriction endonuclease McrA